MTEPIVLAIADGFAVLGDVNGDGMLDIVSTHYYGASTAKVFLNNGAGSFNAFGPPLALGLCSFSSSLGDVNGDGVLDLVAANYAEGTVSVLMGKGDGTFKPQSRFQLAGEAGREVVLGDLNGDGALDIIASNYERYDDRSSILLGKGDGTFGPASRLSTGVGNSIVVMGDLTGDGVNELVSVNTYEHQEQIFIGQTRDGISPILPFSLGTKADALQALAPLQRNLGNLAMQRGVLGAFESRLSAATATLRATMENYMSAESRIRDADVSQESANLTRQQILQQVGAAMLAQANQSPQIALGLLNSA